MDAKSLFSWQGSNNRVQICTRARTERRNPWRRGFSMYEILNGHPCSIDNGIRKCSIRYVGISFKSRLPRLLNRIDLEHGVHR